MLLFLNAGSSLLPELALSWFGDIEFYELRTAFIGVILNLAVDPPCDRIVPALT